MMRRICVFCGSSPEAGPEYHRAAAALGGALARRGIGLVYGGARMGTMDTLAAAALAGGGDVIGVIPRGLVDRERARLDLPDLRIVGSLHERKALMGGLADVFIAMPGGLGTLDELSEVLSQIQLGAHAKPVGLLNTCGFFDLFVAFLDHAVDQGFIDAGLVAAVLVEDDPGVLLDRLLGALPA